MPLKPTPEKEERIVKAGPTRNPQEALWISARAGSAAGVAKYLALGANPSAPEAEDGGATPVHQACRYESDECLLALLAAGARWDLMDGDGASPIHSASLDVVGGMGAMFGWEPVDGSRLPLLRLLELGAGPNLIDNYGRSPLACAAQTGFESAAVALLAAGGDPLWRSKNDESLADLARTAGFEALSCALLAAEEKAQLEGAGLPAKSARLGLRV